MSRKATDYKSDTKPIWCPRCGDFGLLSALYKTFETYQQPPEDTVLVSGIGCSSRIPGFVNTYGFHGVHGRLLPVAMGIKMASPKLKVIGIGGDGDGLAIGLGHFLHAARRNLDVLYILLDNNVYGLTKGQNSPTTQKTHLTKSDPFQVDAVPINPVTLALSSGAGFVARLYTGHMQDMLKTLSTAFEYKGFAFVHALSPCTVFYDTYQMYNRSVKPLPDNHDLTDFSAAQKASRSSEPIYTGVFYNEQKETLMDRMMRILEANQQDEYSIKHVLDAWNR